jgi:nucleoid-associated protein YgaU
MGIFDFMKPKKPPPDFGNVKGGSSSTSPAPERAPVDASVMEYRVVKGDSLSKIAQRIYGDAQAWRGIYDANRDVIDDPDLIHPGQVLKVPKKEGGSHA